MLYIVDPVSAPQDLAGIGTTPLPVIELTRGKVMDKEGKLRAAQVMQTRRAPGPLGSFSTSAPGVKSANSRAGPGGGLSEEGTLYPLPSLGFSLQCLIPS